MPTYRSGRALSRVIIGLVSLYTLVLLFYGAAAIQYLVTEDLHALTRTAAIPEQTTIVLYVLSAIVSLVWVHRSVANLHVLGQYEMSPSQAVWAFLIPILNLWKPHEVMAKVWTESQPAPISENGYSLKRPTTLVTSWWAVFVIACFYTRIITRIEQPKSIEALNSFIWYALGETILWTAAAGMYIWMVSRTQQRQDAQWHDLELRRNAPQPDPMALR